MSQLPDQAAAEAMTDRYGRPSVIGRRVGVAAIAVVVVALLGWLVWAALGQSHESVGGVVESYDVRSPHQVSVTVQITQTSSGAARCTVVALASDHAEVGQHLVRLPSGPSGTRTLTVTVRTEREATAADITDCR